VSDGRSIDVDTDIATAVGHFGKAVEIYRLADFDAPGLQGYKASASFQFAVQAGYTAAESALKRIMDILREEQPTGEEFHKDLVIRLSRPRTDAYARPALLTEAVAKDLLEAKRAKHRARHSYDDFDAAKAVPTVAAIQRLVTSLPAAVVDFRKQVDSEAGDDEFLPT